MHPESLFVIMPCWFVALSLELAVVYFFVKISKDKK